MDDVKKRVSRPVRRYLTLAASVALVAGVALRLAFGGGVGSAVDPHAHAASGPLPTGDTSRLSRYEPVAVELPAEQVVAPEAVSADAPAAPAQPPHQPPKLLQRLFAAIGCVESMDGRRPVGDGGLSLGQYHIGRPYWGEAVRVGGVEWDYDTRVWSPAHCRQVMVWYWQRWCPDALAAVQAGRPRAGDLEKLARIHNGGPNGATKARTWRHWQRVRDAMSEAAPGTRR